MHEYAWLYLKYSSFTSIKAFENIDISYSAFAFAGRWCCVSDEVRKMNIPVVGMGDQLPAGKCKIRDAPTPLHSVGQGGADGIFVIVLSSVIIN